MLSILSLEQLSNEEVHGIIPQVTPYVMSNSPFYSQARTRQVGMRI